MSTTTKRPQATKKYAKLLALLDGDEAAATKAWNAAHPTNKITVKAPVATEPVTSAEKSEAQVAKAGFVHTRGRVYVNAKVIEAAVRVLKTGSPEIVRNDGSHRTKAIAVYRLDAGDSVALQNLGEPRA